MPYYRRNIDVLKDLVRAFSFHVVQLSRIVRKDGESVLSSQFLRSGTSIGANIAEGCYAQTRSDAIAKFYIAQKEAAETLYWLDLFEDMGLIAPGRPYAGIRKECMKVLEILAKVLKAQCKARDREREND